MSMLQTIIKRGIVGNERKTSEVFRFGKTKNNRIVPMIIKVINNKVAINGVDHFRLLFKTISPYVGVKENYLTCYIIINQNLQIINYSDLATTLFLIVNGSIINDSNNLLTVFPDFNENIKNISQLIKKEKKFTTKLDENHKKMKKLLNEASINDTILFDILNDESTEPKIINIKCRNQTHGKKMPKYIDIQIEVTHLKEINDFNTREIVGNNNTTLRNQKCSYVIMNNDNYHENNITEAPIDNDKIYSIKIKFPFKDVRAFQKEPAQSYHNNTFATNNIISNLPKVMAKKFEFNVNIETCLKDLAANPVKGYNILTYIKENNMKKFGKIYFQGNILTIFINNIYSIYPLQIPMFIRKMPYFQYIF